MYFFFSFSPKHQNSGMLTTHMDSFLKRVSHSLRFTQFSLHIKKAIPLCYVLHACMYFEWWFTLNKQCDDFSIDTCNQMLLPSDTQNVLNIRLILATSMNRTHTMIYLYTHLIFKKKKLIELRIEIRIFTPKENDF